MTLDLARITALADVATEGPWASRSPNELFRRVGTLENGAWGPVVIEHERGQYYTKFVGYHDAAFIAAARTAVPEMAKEIGRLRADMESYREGVRRTIKHNVDERLAALAEVERLRAALEVIANDQMPHSYSLQKIARKALK